MKIRTWCDQCIYYRRKTYSHGYEPPNFHKIGMTHAYAYCEKHQKRCSEIKSCSENPWKGGAE